MKGNKGYNGHKNYNHWNVALWINNDYGLYCLARDLIKELKNRDKATEALLNDLHGVGIYDTPDHVRYTKTAIRAAMVGM